MRRKIEQGLISWKEGEHRKPLILQGARQVGKTHSVLEFGHQHYDDVAYIDFSAQKNVCTLFESDILPEVLLPQLQIVLGKDIVPGKTLLFFDEIQACDRALTSLKYFNEQAPEYHIIAAGSLLGVSMNRRDYSYPVGQIQLLEMHPMDFEEFLWSLDQEGISELIQEHYANNSAFALHEQALDLYREYLFVGGMPGAVKTYREDKDSLLHSVRAVQNRIADVYVGDMTKYATPLDSVKILNVWQSIPKQLAKENHKFQYKTIASSARAHQYEATVNWLTASGIITPCFRVSDGVAPLPALAEHDFFKLYLADTGLLSALFDVRREDLLPSLSKNSHMRGGLTENYVAQQLTSGGINYFYWGTSSKSEVEFVFRNEKGDVIPVEVKAGKNVTSRSLEAYRNSYNPAYIMRVSPKNFGFENNIKSVPLYATFCVR